MPSIDNLTDRDIRWIQTAVDAVAALPSSGLPGDNVRHEEWKALADKLKAAPKETELDTLKSAIKKIVVFNPHDVRRPMVVLNEGALQTIWKILGYPTVAQKR